jgi:hypothetical protein
MKVSSSVMNAEGSSMDCLLEELIAQPLVLHPARSDDARFVTGLSRNSV